jgi:hypothetical protein
MTRGPKPKVVVPPVQSSVPIDAILGDDEEDTRLRREMSLEAADYVRSFEWCLELHEQFFGGGVASVVALFLHRVSIRTFEDPNGYEPV